MINGNKNGLYLSNGEFKPFDEIKKEHLNVVSVSRQMASNFDLSNTEALPNPDPVLKKMGETIKVYEDLLGDPKVEAVVKSRRAGTVNLLWSLDRGLEPSDNLEFYEAVLNGLDLKKVRRENFNAILYGYSPAEITWGTITEGSKIYTVPKAITSKPSKWFVFDTENNLRFLNKDSGEQGELVHPTKFLVFKNDADYENPYGVGILSRVFWPVTFKKNGWRFWMIFSEKYGMPWAIGKHPRNAKTEEIRGLLNSLENMVRDAVAAIPDDNSIELKTDTSKASSSSGYEKIIDKANSEISLAIVGQTLTTEVGGAGSLAAGSVHKEIKDEIVDADKETFETEINKLLQWVAYYNFGDPNLAPKFTLHRKEDIDDKLATRDKTLSDTGQIKFSKKYWMKQYNFSEDDIEVVEESKPINEKFSQQKYSEYKKGLMNFNQEKEKEDDLNILTEQFKQLDNYNEQLDKMLTPVIDMVLASKNYSEVQEKLKNIYPEMDIEGLQEQLAKAMFISEGLGIVNSN